VQCKAADGSRMVPPDCGLNTGMETWPRSFNTIVSTQPQSPRRT
jgi:hypothetical protein